VDEFWALAINEGTLFKMFSFFQIIFTKITSAVAGVIIAVGLVSAPAPQPEPPQQIKIVEEIKEEPRADVEQILPPATKSASVSTPATATAAKVATPLTKSESTAPALSSSVPSISTTLQLKTSPPPLSVPQIPAKILKVTPDKTEFWASGFHYAQFHFEKLVDGKSIPGTVTLTGIEPPIPISAGWQAGIPTDKTFSFSVEGAGIYTLKFVADNGAKGEVTVNAKTWPDRKELDTVPIATKSSAELLRNASRVSEVLLGSFKIRANPDVAIWLYDCTVSSEKGAFVTQGFESYAIRTPSLIDDKVNNCFNSIISRTDDAGLSEEFSVYIKNVSEGGTFYLNSLTIKEVETGNYLRATSSLRFDLEITKE